MIDIFNLSSKKPPFEKTKSPNDNTEISCRENYALEIYGIFYQNHGLTPFQICPIFNYRKMTFLSSKRPPIEKTTSWKDMQHQGLLYRKQGSRDI